MPVSSLLGVQVSPSGTRRLQYSEVYDIRTEYISPLQSLR